MRWQLPAAGSDAGLLVCFEPKEAHWLLLYLECCNFTCLLYPLPLVFACLHDMQERMALGHAVESLQTSNPVHWAFLLVILVRCLGPYPRPELSYHAVAAMFCLQEPCCQCNCTAGFEMAPTCRTLTCILAPVPDLRECKLVTSY